MKELKQQSLSLFTPLRTVLKSFFETKSLSFHKTMIERNENDQILIKVNGQTSSIQNINVGDLKQLVKTSVCPILIDEFLFVGNKPCKFFMDIDQNGSKELLENVCESLTKIV